MNSHIQRSDIRLLIVDDENALRESLCTYLELEGFQADTAASAEEAMTLDIAKYDLILLDIMMNGMSGTDFAMKIKENKNTAHVPIIFLTAKDSDDDMVAGLSLGADDYIAKPFSAKNVIARIEAVIRRSAKGKTTSYNKNEHRKKGVFCDRLRLICTVDGIPVKMPKKEFEILSLLLENPDRIFTRQEIMQSVWPDDVVVLDRSVDVHITRIRNKIAPYDKHIISRSGYGYGWQN